MPTSISISTAAKAALLAVAVVAALVPLRPASAAIELQPSVVVAVADTGVNPYHEIYYRPANTAHPCTWVAGFDDCSIPALPLSVGEHATYAQAVAADQELWDSVEPHQWYWIPKTNIIGAVCDTTGLNGELEGVCILDDEGHGTATTSSVLTEAPDALLLVHDGNSGANDLATAPVAPDIQSHSWGPPFAPQPTHLIEPVVPGDPSLLCRTLPFDPETIFFLAAGNETSMPAIADCARAFPSAHLVGGAYPGVWDNGSWWSVDFASWGCRPAAEFDHLSELDDHCGSSFSAPTAAGAAAAALLEVRRHDGYTGRSTTAKVSTSVTKDGFVQAMRTGASYDPEPKFDNSAPGYREIPLPEQAPFVFWGYGWLDSTVSEAVASCALGRACTPKTSEAQTYNAQRQTLRAAMTQDLVPAQHNDAGSGRDAGGTRRTGVPVEAGVTYAGRIDSYVTSGDYIDIYRFPAAAGRTIDVAETGLIGCWQILDPQHAVLHEWCRDPVADDDAPPIDIPTTTAGQYLLKYEYRAQPLQDYTFRIDVS